MKKLLISFAALITSTVWVNAQSVDVSGHFYGEDAFRFSHYSNYGSARSIGMGGAFTALGGDASSTVVNPAGLGFYNKSEFSISPVFRNLTTSTSYLGNSSERSSSDFGLGQASVVISKPGRSSGIKRSNFGISYNTLVNFHNEYDYQGVNNRSSIMDFYAEQANQRGADTGVLDSEFDTNTGFSDTRTSMYYQAYMINPFEGGYVVSEPSFPVEQRGSVSESGNLGQINLTYAANLQDKTYIGASLGLQTLNYNMVTNHTEFFPQGEVFNGFRAVDDLVVSGFGANLSVGAIFNLSRNFKLGANVTTPTIMGVKETLYSAISIDPKPDVIQTDFNTVETLPGDYKYNFTSPLRGNVGVSYMLPRKVGMLSLEAEYVSYGNMGVKDKEDNVWSAEQKRGIQGYYKDVVNVKGGLELRKDKFRVRGGVNYMPDPVKVNNGLDRTMLIVSGGLGYRAPKFFIDAAYSANTFDSSYSPYTLSNEQNFDSALVSSKSGNLTISVGTFF